MIKRKRIRGRYSNLLEVRAISAEQKAKMLTEAHNRCVAWRDEEIKRLRRSEEMLRQMLAVIIRELPERKIKLSYADVDAESAPHLIVAPHEDTMELIYMGEEEMKAAAKIKQKRMLKSEPEPKLESELEPEQDAKQ